ncbi:MAG: hypothetical protein ACRD0U_00300 [Acidimicrobiales bacterium]
MATVAHVRRLLCELCPDLDVDRVEQFGEGDFGNVYLVNGDWVFRIAKHREAAESLSREACLLTRIAGCVDLNEVRLIG